MQGRGCALHRPVDSLLSPQLSLAKAYVNANETQSQSIRGGDVPAAGFHASETHHAFHILQPNISSLSNIFANENEPQSQKLGITTLIEKTGGVGKCDWVDEGGLVGDGVRVGEVGGTPDSPVLPGSTDRGVRESSVTSVPACDNPSVAAASLPLDCQPVQGPAPTQNKTNGGHGGPPHQIKIPKGETYIAIESRRGELGLTVVSDGTDKPARMHRRSPSLYHLHLMGQLCRGYLLADLFVIYGSLDIMIGEVDR